MENKGLVFIPDISGFSRFVSETEIEHSRLIIQELLEILINANQLGLEVSEIEGDAILFYKFGDPPDLKALYTQVEHMFCSFHRNLIAYELTKYCQCKACLSAINLSLKVITHYGEFTGYTVRNFSKLIGKDIIVAHQLLKNDIADHEYWLITKSLVKDSKPLNLADWMQWNIGAKQTETGDVSYHYAQLGHLKHELTQVEAQPPELAKKVRAVSVSEEYDNDMITLFHACGNFNYRARWQEGVEKVEELSHYLPRVGMRCRSTHTDGKVITYVSSYYKYQPERIEFSETDEKDKSVTYFTLEKLAPLKTKLTIDFYLNKTLPVELVFRLMKKKKIEEAFYKSLQTLKVFAKGLYVPSAKDFL
ncbi:Protein of unknown function [Chryseolinea serpens]|uniref:DUF2652 domain-containing protein n=1 Tax=Chryseolinea serpens TaxID=947013 RepID=A0A1M5N208_9BACT|nr:DUF2652 domain-containing protein [Chryseolinea serpens]SHG83590.1 Protein of unknown function [Chryseolinea serpens]